MIRTVDKNNQNKKSETDLESICLQTGSSEGPQFVARVMEILSHETWLTIGFKLREKVSEQRKEVLTICSDDFYTWQNGFSYQLIGQQLITLTAFY